MLELLITKKSCPRLLKLMSIHYSKPKGFVGRNICYAIFYNDIYYGHIVSGSPAKYLPGRRKFLGLTMKYGLNCVIDNVFFHVFKVNGKYPRRNFVSYIIKKWMKQTRIDWIEKYKIPVVGFETLVEIPRTGECYLRAGWVKVGKTKGYNLRRVSGKEKSNWSGKRVWNINREKRKYVFCYKIKRFPR